MHITRELEDDFQLSAKSIEKIEVKYPKKKEALGKLKEFKNNPLEVSLYDVKSKKINEEIHTINFEEALEISIFFKDGKISSYQDSEEI